MPHKLCMDTEAPQWAELRALAEDLRCADAAAAQAHGLAYVFCAESYGLRQVRLDQPTLVLVLEGRKRYAREGEGSVSPSLLSEAPCPSLLLLPADTPLYIENIPARGRYLALCLSFSPALMESAARHSLPHAETENPDPAALGTLLSALTLLVRSALSPAAASCARLLEVQSEQILLLLMLLGLGPRLLSRRDEVVGSALELIRQSPHLPWTVDSLAEHLHCSGRTLRRRLQQDGRSLRELLRHARLHTALGMLQQQRCTVSEAAFSCGYDSLSRFSQRFREHFGLLPSELLRGTGAEERQAVQ